MICLQKHSVWFTLSFYFIFNFLRLHFLLFVGGKSKLCFYFTILKAGVSPGVVQILVLSWFNCPTRLHAYKHGWIPVMFKSQDEKNSRWVEFIHGLERIWPLMGKKTPHFYQTIAPQRTLSLHFSFISMSQHICLWGGGKCNIGTNFSLINIKIFPKAVGVKSVWLQYNCTCNQS